MSVFVGWIWFDFTSQDLGIGRSCRRGRMLGQAGQGDDESAGRSGIDRGDGSLIHWTRFGYLLLMSLLEQFAHLAFPWFDDVVECGTLQPGAYRQNLWRNRQGSITVGCCWSGRMMGIPVSLILTIHTVKKGTIYLGLSPPKKIVNVRNCDFSRKFLGFTYHLQYFQLNSRCKYFGQLTPKFMGYKEKEVLE